MILHKILSSPEAGTYLPFGLARLRALEKIYGSSGFFQEKYLINGFRVEIQQSPPFQYVRISGGGAYFEFATSGFPLITDDITQEALTLKAYEGAIVGVNISGSTLTSSIVGGSRYAWPASTSKVKRLMQAALADEPATRRDKNSVLYQSSQPSNPHTGIYINAINDERSQAAGGYHLIDNQISLTSMVERYPGIDVPFVLGTGTTTVKPNYIRTDADWPRANGIQTVDGRSFAIYVDAFNQFFVYPLGDSTAVDGLNQNVPADDIVMHRASLPAWAMVSTTKAVDTVIDDITADTWTSTQPDLDWKFNPDGTKACCVAHKREVAGSVSYGDFYATGALSGAPSYDGYPLIYPSKFEDAGDYNSYAIGIGLIEVAVNIEITGPDINDFTVNLVATTKRDPDVTTRCTFLADYSWTDLPDLGIAKGDLLTIDIERWYQPSPSIPDPSWPREGNWQLGGMYTGDRSYSTGGSPWDPYNPDTGFWNWYGSSQTLPDAPIGTWYSPPMSLYDFFLTWPVADPSYSPSTYQMPSTAPPFATGKGTSFFVLRKIASETTLLNISGESMLAADLKAVSFVVGLEHEARDTRTVSLAASMVDRIFVGPTERPTDQLFNHKLPPTTDLVYKTSHPATAVYVLGVLEEVFFPDAMSDAVKAVLQTKAESDPTAILGDGYVYLPYDDTPDWGTKPDLQNYLVNTGYPYDDTSALMTGAVTVADVNWWIAGINAVNGYSLLNAGSAAHCGWYAYNTEILKRNKISGHTTFFAHPHGTWALYDAQRLYNRHGMPAVGEDWSEENALTLANSEANKILVYAYTSPDGFIGYHSTLAGCAAFKQLVRGSADMPRVQAVPVPDEFGNDPGQWATFLLAGPEFSFASISSLYAVKLTIWYQEGFTYYDTQTPFLADAEAVSHFVIDHVHFNVGTVAKDTTFRALYNAAAGGAFQPITSENAKALITTGVSELTVGSPAEFFPDSGAVVRVEWPRGTPAYIFDCAYHNPKNDGAYPGGVWPGDNFSASLMGHAYRPYLSAGFFKDSALVNYAGNATIIPLQQFPITFSSCALLGV